MSSLRIRIEINKGGIGVTLHKLVQISLEWDRFLKSFSHDLHLDLRHGDWIARDFENNSVEYIAEYVGPAEEPVIEDSKKALGYIMNEKSEFKDLSTKISRATVMQFARIAKEIDPDEVVEFGLYNNGNGKPSDTHKLSKQRALEIEKALKIDDVIGYSTSIQGKIHSLFKEVDRPHLFIRELATGDRILCYYSNDVYDQIAEALKSRDAIVHAAGWVTASRETRKPIYMRIEKLHSAEPYLEGDLEKFFGCAPDMVHDDSLDEFLDLTHQDE
jgi:hypothetical protein